jgi:hypothetical protein
MGECTPFIALVVAFYSFPTLTSSASSLSPRFEASLLTRSTCPSSFNMRATFPTMRPRLVSSSARLFQDSSSSSICEIIGRISLKISCTSLRVRGMEVCKFFFLYQESSHLRQVLGGRLFITFPW